jgi:hypothetical protein
MAEEATIESTAIEVIGKMAAPALLDFELTVVDEETKEMALDLIKQIRDHVAGIEAQRKAFVKPLKDVTSAIDAATRKVRVPLQDQEQALRDSVNSYLSNVAEERRVAEAAREKAQLESGQVTDPGLLPVVHDEPVLTEGGTRASVRDRPVVETLSVQDLALGLARRVFAGEDVDDRDWALLTVDGQEVRRQIAEGRREFPPGLQLRIQASVAVR